MLSQYFYNLGVWFSQTISVWLGGHPDESISERVARAYLYKPESFFKYLKQAIDVIVYMLIQEKNHTINSLNGEARAKEVWNWGGKNDL